MAVNQNPGATDYVIVHHHDETMNNLASCTSYDQVLANFPAKFSDLRTGIVCSTDRKKKGRGFSRALIFGCKSLVIVTPVVTSGFTG